MKRIHAKLVLCVFILISSLRVFAGDAAVFHDIGFSKDGKTYVFAQYGRTDKKYEAWAEIYTVDVAANDYVAGGVFRIKPSSATNNKSGKQAFTELNEKAAWSLKKYDCKAVEAKNLLYVRDAEFKKSTDEIVFKDFNASTEEKSYFYHIQLVPTVTGTGKNVQSKFYINLEKKDSEGNLLLSKKVGTPDLLRKGISGYRIDRIFTDDSGKSIVFIVEKTMVDDTGTSIRYMVETVRL
ncbi:MAG: DUF2259 domain-containing protein [Treponema sp.]|nr:DUF2259 domain-containing protein [Treponema sp.]